MERDQVYHRSRVVQEFCVWLRDQRGACPDTLSHYAYYVGRFVEDVGEAPRRYAAAEIRRSVERRSAGRGAAVCQKLWSAVRSFLRYLAMVGRTRPGLEYALPRQCRWRLQALPRYLPESDIERVLAVPDMRTPVGLRDRAILLLLARLGLRAGEVARLRVDDVDWSGARFRITGKNACESHLPLVQDVGDALLEYLQAGRPAVACPEIFVHHRAPCGPFLDGGPVSGVAQRALARAGVVSPAKGAHVFRHSAAHAWLERGASLETIATVLRHSSLQTTAIYAKVDLQALRLLAEPWLEVCAC